jgi:predicted nuclease of predicted toxin-antitoxin system
MSWQDLNFSDEEMSEYVKEFKAKARFYLDEPVSQAVREMLEQQGYKVFTARDFSMTGRADEDHAALCWREGMILVSTGKDFLERRKLPDNRNPGVVVLAVGNDGADAAYRAA